MQLYVTVMDKKIVQLLVFILAGALSYFAKILSRPIVGMDISTIISKELKGIFSDTTPGISLLENVFLPALLLIIAACLFFGLIYYYFLTRDQHGGISNWLQWGIIVVQSLMLGYFAFTSLKLISIGIIVGLALAFIALLVGSAISQLGRQES